MHLTFTGVNPAFHLLVKAINNSVGTADLLPTRKEDSRNGKVKVIDEPMTFTYTRPWERVLFNSARDANPFLHLYEALWMLAGSNKLAPLMYYCNRMKEYSDDYVHENPVSLYNKYTAHMNGAYGCRWRYALAPMWVGTSKLEHSCQPIIDEARSTIVDQLDVLIHHLKVLPTSRRAILAMWNVEDDLLKIGDDKNKGSLDVCCNLNVMFSLRDERKSSVLYDTNNPSYRGTMLSGNQYLDMTVTNRSNDLVLGMLGANFTTFSYLMEYVACCLDVKMGRYHHFTNNLHAYEWNWKPAEWLNVDSAEPNYNTMDVTNRIMLVNDKTTFDSEVAEFVKINGELQPNSDGLINSHMAWTEPFLRYVAQPMCSAWHMHKHRDYSGAEYFVSQVKAPDWRYSAQQWISKRRAAYESKVVSTSNED